ncbi:MAG TPA: hypothetical protein VI248_29880 [Kineosporiaceae bacterium]
MRTEEELFAAKDRAVGRLLALPGVTAVGLGGREVGGAPTGELVLRVYVERKLPLDALPAEHLVPAEIEGLATDVAEMGRHTFAAGPPVPGRVADVPADFADDETRRPLVGGSRLMAENRIGTLGCLLEHQTDPAKVYALTNWHVAVGFDSRDINAPFDAIRAGQPKLASCTRCCSRLIGTVAEGEFDEIRGTDFAVIQLDVGMDWTADIFEIGAVAGTHTLTTGKIAGHDYQVRKRGHRTRLTGGTVDALGVSLPLLGFTVQNSILVKANPDPTSPPTQPIVFVLPGDSGSALVNDANEVVGLVFSQMGPGFEGRTTPPGTQPLSFGGAVPIDRILTRLTELPKHLPLKVATAASAGIKRTVPGHAMVAVPEEVTAALGVTAGAMAGTSAAGSTVGSGAGSAVGSAAAPERFAAGAPWLPAPLPDPGFARAVQSDLDRSRSGRALIDAWLEHQDELLDLVNGNRRVAAVWHRSGGSALFQLFIRMPERPDVTVPRTVHGRPLSDCLDRIQSAFGRYGSSRLRSDLERIREQLPDLAGLSYPQFIAALGID